MPKASEIQGRLFFNGPVGVRSTLFDNRLTQRQVDGMNRVCKTAFDDFGLPVPHVAYILATSYHETGRLMHPVREAYGKTDEETMARLEAAWKAGKLPWVRQPYWRKGYFGRGEVQLTWLANYKRMDKPVRSKWPDVDIVNNPNVILEMPEVSTFIMVYGMVNGSFTGKSLADYGDGKTRFDHNEARAIINPHEHSTYDLVGGYSIKFMQALNGAIR